MLMLRAKQAGYFYYFLIILLQCIIYFIIIWCLLKIKIVYFNYLIKFGIFWD